jgi:hypothetical protein
MGSHRDGMFVSVCRPVNDSIDHCSKIIISKMVVSKVIISKIIVPGKSLPYGDRQRAGVTEVSA